MKKIAVAALTALVLFSACSRPKKDAAAQPAGEGRTAQEDAPRQAGGAEWLKETPPADALWGIGTAKMAAPSMSMTIAQSRGQAALVRGMLDLIKSAIDEYQPETGADAAACRAVYERAVSEMSKGVTLTGVRTIESRTDEDGAVRLVLQYSRADAKRLITETLSAASDGIPHFDTGRVLYILDARLSDNRPLIY